MELNGRDDRCIFDISRHRRVERYIIPTMTRGICRGESLVCSINEKMGKQCKNLEKRIKE